MNEYTHRIYGREKGQKRFRPLDLQSARFVVNLIYATILPESLALLEVAHLNDQNPNIEFEARPI